MKVSIIGGRRVGWFVHRVCVASSRDRARYRHDRRQSRRGGGARARFAAGAASMGDQYFHAGGYEHVKDSDLICITAGLRASRTKGRSI